MLNKMKMFLLTSVFMSGAAAMPAYAVTVVSGSGTITSTDLTQTDRISRDGVPSIWASTKAFPGTIAQSPTYYDLINGTFASNALQTIYYEISYSGTNTSNPLSFSAAYQDTFDATNIATNYLGDSGSSPLNSTQTYQVIVAAGHQLLVNFQNVNGTPVNYDYTVSAFSDSNRGENFVSTSAVPEPATWAMMILGMGAIGFSMRSAKRRSEDKFDAKIKRITDGALA